MEQLNDNISDNNVQSIPEEQFNKDVLYFDVETDGYGGLLMISVPSRSAPFLPASSLSYAIYISLNFFRNDKS